MNLAIVLTSEPGESRATHYGNRTILVQVIVEDVVAYYFLDTVYGCAYSAKREVRNREVRPGLKRKNIVLRKWLRSEV